MAVRVEGVSGVDHEFHAGNAVAPCVGVRTTPGSGAIDQHIGVMNNLGRSGADFHRADVVGLVERIWQDEVEEDVGAGRGKSGRMLNGEDKVRLAESPGSVVLRNWRRFGGIAARHASGHPLLDEGDFF